MKKAVLHAVQRVVVPITLVFMLALGVAGCSVSPEEHLTEAMSLRDQGDIRGSVIELKNALQQDPLLAEARLQLGIAAIDLGDFSGGEKELQRAFADGADVQRGADHLYRAWLNLGQNGDVLEHATGQEFAPSPTGLALQGRARLALGQVDLAEADFNEALAQQADNSDAMVGLGWLAASRDDPDGAAEWFNKAREANPANPDAWLSLAQLHLAAGELEMAIDAFTSARKATPQPMVKLQANLGIMGAQLRIPDAAAALATFGGMRGQFQDTPQAKYLQGLALFEQGELSAASDALLGVQKFLPNHLPTLMLQGLIAGRENRLEVAQAKLEQVLAANNRATEVRKLLANIYLQQDEPKKAADVLEPAASLENTDAQVFALMGNALVRSGDAVRALTYLERAAELVPDAGQLKQQIALSHLALGQEAEAVASLRSAAEMPSGGIQSEALLVFVKLRAGDVDGAKTEIDRIAGLYPDDPLVDVLRGLASMAAEDVDTARQQMQAALTKKPGYAPAHNYLASIEAQQGNVDAARGHYQALLDEDTAQVRVVLALAQLERQAGANDAALKVLQDGVTRFQKSAQVRVELARQYLAMGKVGLAVSSAEAAEELNATPVGAVILAESYLRDGKADAAVDALAGLAADNPDNAQIRLIMGRAQLAAGFLGAARDNLTRSLELVDGNNAQALQALTATETRSQNYSAALKWAEQWRKLEPESSIPVIAYANAELESGRSQAAQRTLRGWLNSHPDDQGVQLALATIQLEGGDSDAAMKQYQDVLKNRPDDVVALNNLAWLYQLAGDSRARRTAEKAFNLAPVPAVADTYGWILLTEGNVDRATELLADAAKGMAENPSVRYHYGVALSQKGRVKQAVAELKAALASEAQFDERTAAQDLLKTLGG